MCVYHQPIGPPPHNLPGTSCTFAALVKVEETPNKSLTAQKKPLRNTFHGKEELRQTLDQTTSAFVQALSTTQLECDYDKFGCGLLQTTSVSSQKSNTFFPPLSWQDKVCASQKVLTCIDELESSCRESSTLFLLDLLLQSTNLKYRGTDFTRQLHFNNSLPDKSVIACCSTVFFIIFK